MEEVLGGVVCGVCDGGVGGVRGVGLRDCDVGLCW